MPGTKRTFSTAFPGATPPKLTKKKTSIAATDDAAHPSLKRAPTLPIADDEPATSSSLSKSLSKRSSTASRGRPSLTKKTSSIEKGALVSRLSGLKSGSIVGETTLTVAPSLTKKASSIKKTSIPSGLTKLAMSKCGSKGSIRVYGSDLIEDVDETEMAAALESLKSKLPKTDTTTVLTKSASKVSMSKSASKASLSKSASKISMSKSISKASIASKASLTKSSSKASVAKSASVRSTASAADDSDAGGSGVGLPPGGLMELAISFDTTGSMYGCLEEVRAKVQDLVQRLQADIPGIRIAIIAHGDYCDANTYIIQWIDFGASIIELCDFVKNVGRTGGGDGPECYELVLLRAREALSWTPGSKRALIVINDNEPHLPGYKYGRKTYHINWRDECAELVKMGVTVYGVQAGYNMHSEAFNKEMADLTGGRHLKLQDFNSIFDFIMMISYREANPDMIPIYAEEMKARKKRMFDAEKVAADFGATSSASTSGGLFGTPASGGLFGTPASGGIFGTPASGGLFGTPASGGLFGTPASGGLFGTPASGGLFGTPASGGLFGAGRKVPKKKVVKKAATGAKRTGVAKTGKTMTGAKKAGAKTAKGTKGAKAAKKGKKKEPKIDTVQKRELVPDAKLSVGKLKALVWSKWVKAMFPVSAASKDKKDKKYASCKSYPALRLKKLFGDSTVPALYEFALTAPGTKAGKKHVVYFRKTVGHSSSRSWIGYLLRSANVRKEVNHCMTSGCSLWIRQALAKGKSKTVLTKKIKEAGKLIKSTYDYAWKKYIWRKVGRNMYHRQLATKKKGGVTLSHGDW